MGVNPNQKKTHMAGQNPPDLAYRLAFAATTEDLEYRLHRLAAAVGDLAQLHPDVHLHPRYPVGVEPRLPRRHLDVR